MDTLPDFPFRRSRHDRLTERRRDKAFLDAAWSEPATRVLVVHDGRLAVSDDERTLRWVRPADAPAGERMLLGAVDGAVHFLVVTDKTAEVATYDEVQVSQAADTGPAAGTTFASLRRMALRLDDVEASLAVHAVALANWHLRHRECSVCGAATVVDEAGASRRCPHCETQHFPRTNPAVIMTVIDDADRCLLAHNAARDERWYSTVAGFVEPGESPEEAVVREVREETGVEVDAVTYLGSQPWPFPSELMLGYTAHAATTDIAVDGEEITRARWFTRDELGAMLTAGDVVVPTTVSISGALITRWYGEALPPRPAARG